MKREKCSLCGKRMKIVDGYYICPDCGSRKSINNNGNMYTTTSNTQSPTPTYTYNYNEDNGYYEYKNTNTNSANKKLVTKIAVAILVICLVFYIVPWILLGIVKVVQFNKVKDEISDIVVMKNDSKKDDDIDGEVTKVYISEVESEGMQYIIMEIFGKEYNDVKPEDLESVIALNFYYNEQDWKMADYRLKDDTEGTVYIGDLEIEESELQIFSKLESLKMEYGSYYDDNLTGLKNLTELWVNASEGEIAEMINPSQITSLGVLSPSFGGEFGGLEKFPNVTKLYVDCSYMESIDGIAALENLKELNISRADGVNNFSMLYDMTQLEVLSIDASHLKDIGFVSNMDNLKQLTVTDSEIKNIDALNECTDTLEVLKLVDNYEVNDYSVVSKMTQLSELALVVSYNFDMDMRVPDLSGLKELKKLYAGNYEYFDTLVNLPQLEELTIEDSYISKLPEIKSLTNLKTLNLISMSVEQNVLEDISKYLQVESIDMNRTCVWGSVNCLLNMPTLRKINMESCQAYIDMENAQTNTQLEVLNMNNITIKVMSGMDGYDFNNEQRIKISTDLFTKYPNLKELYIEKAEIDNISFVESLPNLEILDIYDNYVTDVTPLTKLENLKVSACESNPIIPVEELKHKVIMD